MAPVRKKTGELRMFSVICPNLDLLEDLELAREELQNSVKALNQIQMSTCSVRDKDKKVAQLRQEITDLTLKVSEIEAKNGLFSIIHNTVANMPLVVKQELYNAGLPPGGPGTSKD
jgi:hypothetical protein